ncbi:unnamed protein product [Gadus morhua 'NCC']
MAHHRADRQHCGPQFWSLSQGGLVSAGWSNIPHRCHGHIPDTSPGWAGRSVTLIIPPSLSGPRLGSPVSRATDSFGGSAAHPRPEHCGGHGGPACHGHSSRHTTTTPAASHGLLGERDGKKRIGLKHKMRL